MLADACLHIRNTISTYILLLILLENLTFVHDIGLGNHKPETTKLQINRLPFCVRNKNHAYKQHTQSLGEKVLPIDSTPNKPKQVFVNLLPLDRYGAWESELFIVT